MKIVLALVCVLIVLVSIDIASNMCYITITDANGNQHILSGVETNEYPY